MKTKLIICLSLILFGLGCGHALQREYLKSPDTTSSIKSVAVIPFENLTKFPDAGQIVATLFTTELYQSTDFRIVDRNQVKRSMRENNIGSPKVIDRRLAQEIGKLLDVDGVFVGSVSEYWYRMDRRSYRNQGDEPAVGINARLVDVASGEVIWASSHSRSSQDILREDRDHINRVAQIAVAEMISSLK